ncbi:lipopolysaccharide biosynthesis protein [Rubricoccus marinus]|uniref:Polysaccharide biosynthesis protein C-terminal domain-containing protein n=1 Tax=Rubricoccus marinus TaxID=716817 RepID=A0A259TZ82_9BACT|nr:lipopolysaccharide biosynthesis protein [Rubricoccus marinus]OZC03085.1 hypothetical protein BSZ36_08935 [Rubricoccus marinus]
MDGARATRNAASSVAQTVLSALLLFGLYRYLLLEIGAEGIGVWSVVLASTGAARIADLGLTGSAVKYVAAYLARGDQRTAAEVVETTVTTIALVIGVMAIAAYFAVGAFLPAIIDPEGVNPAALDAARALLPWACLSFWLVSVAGAAQSGLDGCARFDLRNAILLGSQVLYVGLAVVLVGPYGLVGLAFAQIVQGLLWFVGLWVAIRQRLPEVRWIPSRLRISLVREMLGYGVNFQILGVLRMLYEPTTKALMGRYGGLELAGLYEVASLAILKLRSLLVAALQVLTPEVASLEEREPERVNEVYRDVDRLGWALTLALFAAVAAAAPLVSHLLVGRYEPGFVAFSLILAVGWGLNSLSAPGFFLLLGTGQMRHVVASHVTVGVVNAAAGWALGIAFGGSGVAWGWALALGLGAAHLVVGLWRQRGVVSLPSVHVAAVGVVLMLAAGAAVYIAGRVPSSIGVSVGALLGFGAVAIVAVWPLPERRRVQAALLGVLGR